MEVMKKQNKQLSDIRTQNPRGPTCPVVLAGVEGIYAVRIFHDDVSSFQLQCWCWGGRELRLVSVLGRERVKASVGAGVGES